MKKNLIGFLAALALVSAESSMAQTLWTSPYGFTLRVPEGWRAIPLPDSSLGPDSTIDLVIGPPADGNPPLKAACTVMHMNRSTPAKVTQERVNSALATWDKNFVV